MIFTMRKTRRTRKKLNALVRDENFIAKKSKSKRRKILIFLLLVFAREKSLFFLFYAFVPKRKLRKRSAVFSSPKNFWNTEVDGPPFVRRPST